VIADIDLDHVAVAAERQADAWARYAGELAGEWLGGGGTPGFWSAQVRYANGMKVEVLEPYLAEQNDFLRRFLDRSGPGPHHLTFKVKDIRTALGQAEEAGYRPVGVDLSNEMWMEAFLHPKDAPGVVVQLAQSGFDGEGDWGSDRPDDLPAPLADRPAQLDRVVHAVRQLDEGLRLFADLLAGQEQGRGDDEGGRWVDLAWPGPGRVRLLEPSDVSSPVAEWIGDRAGRVHHLEFTADDPAALTGGRPLGDGSVEVPPEANLGVRLIVRPTT
jgi:catechol 2,3-dioxygenase-like lactoylglutathione lyase family enzyme